MSDENLICQAAPTLAGIKTGSLFPYPYESRDRLQKELRELNLRLSPKGVCVIPMRCTGKNALLYLFRPNSLERDLSDEQTRELLTELGYTDLRRSRCLSELIRRFNAGGEFPHEIGLFLSYPPEDVRGFIEHKGNDCKCVGCWKVYGDEAVSRVRFDAYKKCTENYRRQLRRGASVENLAAVCN